MATYNGFKCRGCNKEGLGIKDVNFKDSWAWCLKCLPESGIYKDLELNGLEKGKDKTLGSY